MLPCKFWLPLALLIVMFQVNAQERQKFSSDEVKADFNYLYQNLKASHFNLYANTSEEKFDREFQQITESITDSMTFLQIHRLFQPFVALSKMGHCNIGYPFKSYNAYMAKGGTVFPFDVSIDEGRIFITGNYSSDTSIKKGDEILAFYGVGAKQWLRKLYRYLSGENERYKNTLVDLIGFPRLYWMVYEQGPVFSLKVRKNNGKTLIINCEGIPAAAYKKIKDAKPSVFNSSRAFRFIDEVAYLRPGAFLNQEPNQQLSSQSAFEKGDFIRFIDSSFLKIYRKNVNDLIIDLRGNPGGDNSFSDPMVAYFASTPFSFCSAFLLKTSPITKAFWTEVTDTSLTELKTKILTKKDGEIFTHKISNYLPRTDSLRFRGNVYVLIDRYSYSNATTVAALIQDYKFGKLIGEQTAESPTLFAASHEFNLPNTKISVTYPKAFMIRPNGDQSLKGVVPDVPVQDKAFTPQDEIMEWTIHHIQKRSK